VADDMEWDGIEQRRKAALVAEGAAECLALQQREDAWGDAASQVDAAGRQYFERQVARLRTKDGNEERGCSRGDGGSPLPLQPSVDNDGRRVVRGGELLGQRPRLSRRRRSPAGSRRYWGCPCLRNTRARSLHGRTWRAGAGAG